MEVVSFYFSTIINIGKRFVLIHTTLKLIFQISSVVCWVETNDERSLTTKVTKDVKNFFIAENLWMKMLVPYVFSPIFLS